MKHVHEKPFNVYERLRSIIMTAAERREAIAHMQRGEAIADRSSNLQHISIRNRNKGKHAADRSRDGFDPQGSDSLPPGCGRPKANRFEQSAKSSRNELRSFGVG
jgi:hypothetical protein